MSDPKQIIETIRKIRFGIGLNISNLSKEQLDALKDKKRILRDAARLAKEINTKRPHFILELIQNAEDNNYEDGVIPRIKFIIRKNELVIQNNEKGFKEKNVWALCGIGETTKKNKSLGYIGEKGIGFKSVFMITNEPHIYSNGFQFKFKYEKEDPISILIPQWIDRIPSYVKQPETNIILKLKSEVKNEINEFVNQIHPSLLLFLKKLRVIEIEDRISRKFISMQRYDKNGIFEIRYGRKKSYWKIVRKLLQVPEFIKEERRKDIHETELILAFPLKNDGSADASSRQNVFAFLPVRGYGFKFIIQADFLLPIGREDIIKDNEWNRWLRDSIVSVFLNAVEHFKVDEKLRYTFYNYLPIDKKVEDDFFKPVVEQIYKELQSADCLLTESNRWRKPSDVLVADDEIRQLVSNDDLQKFFKKEYLSSRIKISEDILRKLNVEKFSTDELLECLKNSEWVEKQNDNWFTLLYKYLSKKKLTDEQMNLLKKLKIIRLENGRLNSVNKDPVFLPLSKRGKYYGFESELTVVKIDILKAIRKLERKYKNLQIVDFLIKLGIKEPNAYEIIENHIIPAYEDGRWKEKDENTLLGYIRYIKDHLKDYEEEKSPKAFWERKDPLRRLKKSLFVRISGKGEKRYERIEDVYLPKIYGNSNDVEILFQGIKVNFLHHCYIKDILREHEKTIISDKTKDKKIRKWRNFFLKLGINDFLNVKKDPDTEIYQGPSYANNEVTKKRIWKWEKEKTVWKDCEWKDSYSGYFICNDWKSNDFERFLEKLEQLPQDMRVNLCKKIVSLFDKKWSRYKRFSSCQYYYRHYGQTGWSKEETPSTFLLTLRNSAWCPTTQNTLAKPSQIFLNKADVREVLGDSVYYLALKIKNEDFIKEVGFNTKANVRGVLNFLITSADQGYEKTNFKKIYEFLNRHFEDDENDIRDAFYSHPIIYIPNTSKKFFTSREVIWEDVSYVFGENRAYLEKHYPKLKYFFVEKLQIPEKPSPKDYADVLVDISEKDEITEKDKHLVLKIYEELNYHLDPSNVEKPLSEESWWIEFVNKSIYLTEKNEFCRNEGNVFINDSEELYDLFSKERNIDFLSLPETYPPDKIRFFIMAAGIRCLSSAIEIKPIFDESSCHEHKELSKRMQNLIPYIIRYLYWKEHSKYEELKNKGFLDAILDLKVYIAKELRVEYTININEWESVSATVERPCILYQNKLYIAKGCEDKSDYIAIEFSRIFGQVKGLNLFILSIYERQSKERIEELLKLMDVKELPSSEKIIFPKIPREISEKKKVLTIHKEVKEPFSPPLESKNEFPEVSTLDLITEKKNEDWVPECLPEEAEVSGIEEYEPKEKEIIHVTRDHARTIVIPSAHEQPYPQFADMEKGLSEKSKIAIGRWGEEYVLKCLKEDKIKKYPDARIKDIENGFILEKDGKTLVKAVWLNKDRDLGREYDIELWEDDTRYFIEVKSTKTEKKDWFDISRAQWVFMREKGDKFFIYRVYGVGTIKPPPLLKICNPAKLWQEGRIDAYPVRIQL